LFFPLPSPASHVLDFLVLSSFRDALPQLAALVLSPFWDKALSLTTGPLAFYPDIPTSDDFFFFCEGSSFFPSPLSLKALTLL